MANKYLGELRIVLSAGKATAGPPVSTMLGPKGVAIKKFCDDFNAATKDLQGKVTAIVKFSKDKSFKLEIIGESNMDLIKKELNLQKCSKKPGIEDIATLKIEQVKKIAEKKIKDTNSEELEKVMNTIIGTAKSMGIKIEG